MEGFCKTCFRKLIANKCIGLSTFSGFLDLKTVKCVIRNVLTDMENSYEESYICNICWCNIKSFYQLKLHFFRMQKELAKYKETEIVQASVEDKPAFTVTENYVKNESLTAASDSNNVRNSINAFNEIKIIEHFVNKESLLEVTENTVQSASLLPESDLKHFNSNVVPNASNEINVTELEVAENTVEKNFLPPESAFENSDSNEVPMDDCKRIRVVEDEYPINIAGIIVDEQFQMRQPSFSSFDSNKIIHTMNESEEIQIEESLFQDDSMKTEFLTAESAFDSCGSNEVIDRTNILKNIEIKEESPFQITENSVENVYLTAEPSFENLDSNKVVDAGNEFEEKHPIITKALSENNQHRIMSINTNPVMFCGPSSSSSNFQVNKKLESVNKGNNQDDSPIAVTDCDKSEPVVINAQQNRRNSQIQLCKKGIDYCYYCKQGRTNITRHYVQKHSCETEVREILSKAPKSKERMLLICRLRRKGNFLASRRNIIKAVKSTKNQKRRLLPCDNCLGFFSSTGLWRHKVLCKKTKTAEQSPLLINKRVDQELKDDVFPCMISDIVGIEAKNDVLICAFGATCLHKQSKASSSYRCVVSRKMRELSRMLITLRKYDPSIIDLTSALHPKYFYLFLMAAKEIAQYDVEKKIYKTRFLPINIGTSLRQCCEIALSDTSSQEDAADLQRLIYLFREKWNDIILSQTTSEEIEIFKQKRFPWTKVQRQVALHYFRHHISSGQYPKQHECEELRKCYPKLFFDKNWIRIQTFIQKQCCKNTCSGLKSQNNLAPFNEVNVEAKQAPQLPEFSTPNEKRLQYCKRTYSRLEPQNSGASVDAVNPELNAAPPLSEVAVPKRKKPRFLVPWTKEQKDVVQQYFRKHIKANKVPKKMECEQLRLQHSKLLHNKDWVKIKVFVQNEYTKRERLKKETYLLSQLSKREKSENVN